MKWRQIKGVQKIVRKFINTSAVASSKVNNAEPSNLSRELFYGNRRSFN